MTASVKTHKVTEKQIETARPKTAKQPGLNSLGKYNVGSKAGKPFYWCEVDHSHSAGVSGLHVLTHATYGRRCLCAIVVWSANDS